ncbi:hypothetical protein TSTA_058320 [Talaromyces stipitatus ATCC 10500]|uniref:Uncharacterized protein n=1 Tax=Talaromyces stipitatus (strain ATCC 10500 / CBS 375.48 / QM 6759 / NRRL 1006) TaxID=441959 RepID=B8MQE1_TALSN|nr:uncharacterized protein TSTA_058320 [Talaromyces stipitatus ATCC 10500]EED13343.1 hypothetical protein TSTA_058320 [Talaromyces stipitatus ATCC 10500]
MPLPVASIYQSTRTANLSWNTVPALRPYLFQHHQRGQRGQRASAGGPVGFLKPVLYQNPEAFTDEIILDAVLRTSAQLKAGIQSLG